MSLNLYGYCEDNPVMSSDPTGHSSRFTSEGGAGNGIAFNAVCTLKNDRLNVYKSTNDSNKNIIGWVGPGERVQLLKESGKMAYIRYKISKAPYHKEGWVHSKFIRRDIEKNPDTGGQPVSLDKGWWARIDSGDGAQQHITIYNDRKSLGKHTQNANGDPKDGSRGGPPSWVKEKIKKE